VQVPAGIAAEGFCQEDNRDYCPDWIVGERLKKEGGRNDHVLVNDAATAVYLANQGSMTLHVGLFGVDRIDRADPAGHRLRHLG
jgi:bifunctional non-homologous end joining protein LigD